jgi:hypothetical protein
MLYLYNGKLLLGSGGKLASSQSCCCDNEIEHPPCNSFPDKLYGRWSNKTGDATNLPTGQFELNRVGTCDPDSCRWDSSAGSTLMGECSPGDTILAYFFLRCRTVDGARVWDATPNASTTTFDGGLGLVVEATSVSYDPLYLVFHVTFAAISIWTCEGTATLEISENPF